MNDARVLKIGIASRDQIKRRAIAISKGLQERLPDEPRVWFSSMESLAKVLSERNMLLLEIIRTAQPRSMAELAEKSGRAKSNLSRTLHTMEKMGLVEIVELSERGRKRKAPRVKYDAVRLDYQLGGSSGLAA